MCAGNENRYKFRELKENSDFNELVWPLALLRKEKPVTATRF